MQGKQKAVNAYVNTSACYTGGQVRQWGVRRGSVPFGHRPRIKEQQWRVTGSTGGRGVGVGHKTLGGRKRGKAPLVHGPRDQRVRGGGRQTRQ